MGVVLLLYVNILNNVILTILFKRIGDIYEKL